MNLELICQIKTFADSCYGIVSTVRDAFLPLTKNIQSIFSKRFKSPRALFSKQMTQKLMNILHKYFLYRCSGHYVDVVRTKLHVCKDQISFDRISSAFDICKIKNLVTFELLELCFKNRRIARSFCKTGIEQYRTM